MAESQNTNHRTPAYWDRHLVEIFVRLCAQEVIKRNRPGTFLNKVGLGNVITKFTEATVRSYSRHQLKNKWDGLKKEWIVWLKLKTLASSLGVSEETGSITADESWWTEALKEDNRYLKFKTFGPAGEEDQRIMFTGIVATGEHMFTPVNTDLCPTVPETQNFDFENHNLEEEHDFDSRMTPNRESEYVPPSFGDDNDGSPAVESSRIEKGRREKKKRKINVDNTDSMNNLASSLHELSSTDFEASQIDRCLKVLRELPGVVDSSEFYYDAIWLFKNKFNRTCFLGANTF